MNDVQQSALAWAAVLRAPGLGAATLLPALAATGRHRALLRRLAAPRLRALGLGAAAADLSAGALPAREKPRPTCAGSRIPEPRCCPAPPPIPAAAARARVTLPSRSMYRAAWQHCRRPQVAMVGSRTPTAAGRKMAARIATRGRRVPGSSSPAAWRAASTPPATKGALSAGGRPSPCSAPASTSAIRRTTAHCRSASGPAARWCRNSRRAHRRAA